MAMQGLVRRLDPDASRARVREAQRLLRTGRLEAARSAVEEVARQYPNYHAAIYTLAAISLELRDLTRALLHAARARMLSPQDIPTFVLLANVYLASDAIDLAEEALDAILRRVPGDDAALVTLGHIQLKRDGFEAARESFLSALARAPGNQAASLGLAQCLARLGDNLGAAKLLVELLRQSSVSADVLFVAAELPDWPLKPDLLQLLSRVKLTEGDTKGALMLRLAKARALDRVGRAAEAWEQAVEARKLARPVWEDAAARRRRRETALLADERSRQWPVSTVSNANGPLTLLLIGPSRSGKSTLERLLGTLDQVKMGFENGVVDDALADVALAAELPPIPSLNQMASAHEAQFRQIYARRARALALDQRVLSNSHPARGYDAARLASIVPGVRLVLLKRNVDDLVVRMMMHPRLGDVALDEASIRTHIAWYFELLDLLAEKLPKISLMTSYEEIVSNPAAVRSRVATLCGVPDSGAAVPELGDDRNWSAEYRTSFSKGDGVGGTA